MKISRKDLFNFTESLVGSIEEVATKIAQIESILSGTDEHTEVEEEDYVEEPTEDYEEEEDEEPTDNDVVEEPAVTEEDEEVVEEPTEETEPVEFSEKSASRYETVKSFLSGE